MLLIILMMRTVDQCYIFRLHFCLLSKNGITKEFKRKKKISNDTLTQQFDHQHAMLSMHPRQGNSGIESMLVYPKMESPNHDHHYKSFKILF
jgi:hypothetical protein